MDKKKFILYSSILVAIAVIALGFFLWPQATTLDDDLAGGSYEISKEDKLQIELAASNFVGLAGIMGIDVEAAQQGEGISAEKAEMLVVSQALNFSAPNGASDYDGLLYFLSATRAYESAAEVFLPGSTSFPTAGNTGSVNNELLTEDLVSFHSSYLSTEFPSRGSYYVPSGADAEAALPSVTVVVSTDSEISSRKMTDFEADGTATMAKTSWEGTHQTKLRFVKDGDSWLIESVITMDDGFPVFPMETEELTRGNLQLALEKGHTTESRVQLFSNSDEETQTEE